MAKRPQSRGVRSSIDTGRLSAAASRPGIDPRIWLTRAVVKDIAFDPAQGLFADIQFQPDGAIETALVGASLAGDDFGSYWPLQVDDIVLVALPMGDPAEGPVIIARLWSGSEKPPVELSKDDLGVADGDVTSNPTIRLKDGTTFRIVGKKGANVKIELDGNAKYEIFVTGGSTVEITADTTVRVAGKTQATLHSDTRIKLGDSATLGVARLTDTVRASSTVAGDPVPSPSLGLIEWTTIVTAFINGLVPLTLTGPVVVAGFISKASTKVSSE